jgi:hypothetical protein
VGLTVRGKIGGRVPAEASSLVRVFTRELGDPRGTWANDRHTNHVGLADGEILVECNGQENASLTLMHLRLKTSRKEFMMNNKLHGYLLFNGYGQLLGVVNNYVTVKIKKHSTAHCNRICGYLIMSTACPAAMPAAHGHL